MFLIGDRVSLTYSKSSRGVIIAIRDTSVGKQIHIALDSGKIVTAYYSMAQPEKYKPGHAGYLGPEWHDRSYQ